MPGQFATVGSSNNAHVFNYMEARSGFIATWNPTRQVMVFMSPNNQQNMNNAYTKTAYPSVK